MAVSVVEALLMHNQHGSGCCPRARHALEGEFAPSLEEEFVAKGRLMTFSLNIAVVPFQEQLAFWGWRSLTRDLAVVKEKGWAVVWTSLG